MTSQPRTSSTPTTTTITPAITDLTRLLRSTLTAPYADNDPIRDCGSAPLAILASRPDDVIRLAHEKLHAFPYKDVPTCWRRLYTEGALWRALGVVEREVRAREREGGQVFKSGRRGEGGAAVEKAELDGEPCGRSGHGEARVDGVEEEDGEEQEEEDWITKVVRTLDMALILAGAPLREELIEEVMARLDSVLSRTAQQPSHRGISSYEDGDDGDDSARHAEPPTSPPSKRRRVCPSVPPSLRASNLPSSFASHPTFQPPLHHSLPRTHDLSLAAFQTHMTAQTTPLIITGALQHWPALCDSSRRWDDPAYLLRRTLGGRRLVPVEVGRSYTDEGWGQRILSVSEFLREFVFCRGRSEEGGVNGREEGQGEDEEEGGDEEGRARGKGEGGGGKRPTGYLAQHDLFAQIPSLRADICVPDYCYATPPPPPASPSSPNQAPPSHLDTPLLNAWFGPAGTISPLHTDPYHNILAQVVGHKYVRLYAPGESGRLYPRGVGADGVDMGNTSWVDVGEAVGVFGEVEGEGKVDDGDADGQAGGGRGQNTGWEGGEQGGVHSRDDGDDHDRSPSTVTKRMKDFEATFPLFKEARYVEGILRPGECLYIPARWWHYVRSLSASFSVSFWWN